MRVWAGAAALLCGAWANGWQPAQPQRHAGPADPVIKDPARFDAKRPPELDLQTRVPDDFSIAAVGDLIISRPLSSQAATLPAFRAVLGILGSSTVAVGNLETTIFDPRHFAGAPYSWDGDWTNSSEPAVAADLSAMGFDLLGRANNHALDWGLEGMRETGEWLDKARLVHAGAGETLGSARAPRYVDGPGGRIALVSLASTFRPGSEALATHGSTPGRPGLSALHVTTTVNVPPAAMRALAEVQCNLHHKYCGETPGQLDAFGQSFKLAEAFSYSHDMDAEDLSQILQSIRTARQHADFVVVAIHSHECSQGCDDEGAPRGAADFLKQLAHDAIDSGADLFITSGNHNLGALEIYDAPGRGPRPIFYGLGNFFWSDVQELLPQDLYRRNRKLLERSWEHPGRATPYDLTAPLNKEAFAHDFTFESVVARSRFKDNRLDQIELHPVELGYGTPLLQSGIPRHVTDAARAAAIVKQVAERTAAFGLPAFEISWQGATAFIRPASHEVGARRHR